MTTEHVRVMKSHIYILSPAWKTDNNTSFSSDILGGKREIHSINAAKDHENEHNYIFLISLIDKEKKNS